MSVHPVPSTSLSRWRSADTTAPTLYTDGASDHLMLKDSSPKPYCPHLRDRRMNCCPTVGSSGAEAPVLARLCLDLNEASDRPMVSSLRPLDHPVLLALLLLLSNSSGATIKWTVGSSDGALVFTQVYQLVRPLHRRLLSRYRRFIRQCHFFSFLSRFWPLKNRLSSQFGMWYFGILETLKCLQRHGKHYG
jgi:hypothetical protein